MSAEPSLALAPGSLIGGKYRLESRLARGGMGEVWVGHHVALGVDVAIKFMDPDTVASEAHRIRFAREAKAAAGLRNRHIVDVRDYGVDQGVPFLVMELLEGEDLGARLRREGRLTLAATAAIVAQAARALRGAHEIGLIHRDLKPGNIFLSLSDGEEIVKVLDFGIAKDTDARFGGDTTRTGDLVGSPHYMSPEQTRGARDLDARSDVWALGVITFRCLTGQLPFQGEALGVIIGQILTEPIPLATEIAPDLPFAINAFFMRALARDRRSRFSSARDLSDALDRLAGAPPSSDRSGVLHRSQIIVPVEVAESAPTPGRTPPEVETRPEGRRPAASPEDSTPIPTPPRGGLQLRTALAGSAVAALLAILLLLLGPTSRGDAPSRSTPRPLHDAPSVQAASPLIAPTASAFVAPSIDAPQVPLPQASPRARPSASRPPPAPGGQRDHSKNHGLPSIGF